jgi:hypothetical protein
MVKKAIQNQVRWKRLTVVPRNTKIVGTYIYFVRIGPYCTVDFLAKGSRFLDSDF